MHGSGAGFQHWRLAPASPRAMAFEANAVAQALAQALMPMMTQLQNENTRNMGELINTVAEKLVGDGHRRNKLIDCRALGRPRDFFGKQT